MSKRARIPIFRVSITYGDGTSGTTQVLGTYVQLVSSLSDDVSELDIFDGGGKAMTLGFGASSAEVDLIHIPPGGQGPRSVILNKGMRVAIKAQAAGDAPTGGQLIITGYR